MKVVGYVRVSTEEQATHGVSLAAQEQKLRQYCELFNHELTEVIVDGGQSAKTLKRPGLQRALELIKTGEAAGILVLKLDRLTRSVRDLGELLEVHLKNAALVSIQEQCDTSSAAGRLMLNLMTSMAQWERETTSERTKTALQYKKSQGVELGAPKMENRDTIARIIQLREAGHSLANIAAALTGEGYATKNGGRWEKATVSKILKREGLN